MQHGRAILLGWYGGAAPGIPMSYPLMEATTFHPCLVVTYSFFKVSVKCNYLWYQSVIVVMVSGTLPKYMHIQFKSTLQTAQKLQKVFIISTQTKDG